MNSRLLLIIFTLFLTACSNAPSREEELSERQYYQQARDHIANNNLFLAVEELRKLEARYPYGRYAEQAQLEMTYAYYQMSDYDNVLTTTERFIRLHPLHEQVDYAYYMRALATYQMGFSFMERRIQDDLPRRDPTPMRDAFQYFSELLVRFPDSPYIADARARMVYIKQRLADYEIGVAHYLMKRHAYMAAANRAGGVVRHYQGTPAVADALALQVEAYRILNMPQESEQALALLQHNHPDHRQLKNGQFIDSGLTMVDRRSFWNIISFGLLDAQTSPPTIQYYGE